VQAETGVADGFFSDVPNILCETDKYLRVKNGEGKPRALYVPGRGFDGRAARHRPGGDRRAQAARRAAAGAGGSDRRDADDSVEWRPPKKIIEPDDPVVRLVLEGLRLAGWKIEPR
jgi:hypothetical protein